LLDRVEVLFTLKKLPLDVNEPPMYLYSLTLSITWLFIKSEYKHGYNNQTLQSSKQCLDVMV